MTLGLASALVGGLVVFAWLAVQADRPTGRYPKDKDPEPPADPTIPNPFEYATADDIGNYITSRMKDKLALKRLEREFSHPED